MTSVGTNRRALSALGALVIAAAIWVPSALAAVGTDVDTTLSSPAITATEPLAAAAVGDAAPNAIAIAIDARSEDATSSGVTVIGASIADAIIGRLRVPTGPVLFATPAAPASPAPVAPAVPVEPAPAPPAPAAASAQAEPDRPALERDPSRVRRPSRNNGADDRIEVEVYGAAIPEPPEVASSTTTETVLVEPDPSDPWHAVRDCESNGNYRINTGNGFYGAYQFTIRTWNWVAGIIDRPGLIGVRPDLAAPADQDRMANALAFEVRGGGLGHWPVCGRLYGR